jgi:hypothetical protein
VIGPTSALTLSNSGPGGTSRAQVFPSTLVVRRYRGPWPVPLAGRLGIAGQGLPFMARPWPKSGNACLKAGFAHNPSLAATVTSCFLSQLLGRKALTVTGISKGLCRNQFQRLPTELSYTRSRNVDIDVEFGISMRRSRKLLGWQRFTSMVSETGGGPEFGIVCGTES